MPHLIVRVTVQNFGRWKIAYDWEASRLGQVDTVDPQFNEGIDHN
jgi:hypothetical protein